MSENEPVKVTIMDSEYRVACATEERDDLLEAAAYLNNTMQGIRDTGKVLGVERIAVMAALNVSYELLMTQKQTKTLDTAIEQRTQDLLAKVEQQIEAVADKD